HERNARLVARRARVPSRSFVLSSSSFPRLVGCVYARSRSRISAGRDSVYCAVIISEAETSSTALGSPLSSRENAPAGATSASSARTGAHAPEIARIADKVENGERIGAEEALVLHDRADMLTLGRLADLVRARKHPEGRVTYIVDRNLNPTNVCITDCGF